MTHSSGGTSQATVDDVLESDVYGMETTEDLNVWMQQEEHLGYITAVVDFNASSSGTTIGDFIRYDIWYNETIINQGWYERARSKFIISVFSMQITTHNEKETLFLLTI